MKSNNEHRLGNIARISNKLILCFMLIFIFTFSGCSGMNNKATELTTSAELEDKYENEENYKRFFVDYGNDFILVKVSYGTNSNYYYAFGFIEKNNLNDFVTYRRFNAAKLYHPYSNDGFVVINYAVIDSIEAISYEFCYTNSPNE